MYAPTGLLDTGSVTDMCGLAGFLTRNTTTEDWSAQVRRMTDQITHRGPDDSGVWVDEAAGVALGHRRLSIVDLSPHGHQPMVSASGRYMVVFNGEIYNFRALRDELATMGAVFEGHSDTEVLLAALEAWGVVETLPKLVGMFAIALWDRERRHLTLIRDRMGEKPLYYGWMGDTLLFGSELKALTIHPAFERRLDRGAVALMMRHNYIPDPYCVFQGVRKLLPGTAITLQADQVGEYPEPVRYWSVSQVATAGQAQPFTGSDEAAIDHLDGLLKSVVADQMLADVPLGAFLSGGIDSSTVVATMQAVSERPVKTFTIGFHEDEYNEAHHGKAVANHLGTEHTELYLTAKDAMEVIPKLPGLYCEPFSDVSQIPTYLVSHMARQHVTVCLSGDGGDELFRGYSRYAACADVVSKMNRIPGPVQAVGSAAILSLPPKAWDKLLFFAAPLLQKYGKSSIGNKLHAAAHLMRQRGPSDVYRRFMSHWTHLERVVLDAAEPPTSLTDDTDWPTVGSLDEQMLYWDMVGYLPGDILVKVDRASMGVSLESREPLLDHRLVEFAWQLPLHMKTRDGIDKWLLRQVLYRYVPQAMIDRPKMGFGVPIGDWIRGPLRDWAEELLSEKRLREDGIFRVEAVRAKWQQHLQGGKDWQGMLWDVLMFQAWWDDQGRP